MTSLPQNHDNTSRSWTSFQAASMPNARLVQEDNEMPKRMSTKTTTASASLVTFFPSSTNSSPCSFTSAKEDVDELELIQYDFSIPKQAFSPWVTEAATQVGHGSGAGSGSSFGPGPGPSVAARSLSQSPATGRFSVSVSQSQACSNCCSYSHTSERKGMSQAQDSSGIRSTTMLDHSHTHTTESCHERHNYYLNNDEEEKHRHHCVNVPSLLSSTGHGPAHITHDINTTNKANPSQTPIVCDQVSGVSSSSSNSNSDNDNDTTESVSVPTLVSPQQIQRPQSSVCGNDTHNDPALSPTPSLHLPTPVEFTALDSSAGVPSLISATMYPRRRYRTVSSTVVSLDIPSMLAGVASVHIVENSHLADGPKRRDSRDSAASQLNRPLPEQGPRRVRIQSAGQLLPSSISVGASSSKLCTTPLHHDLHHRVSEDTTGLQYYRDATLPLKQQQQQQHPPVLRPHVYPSSSSPFTSSSSSSPSSSSSSCLTKTLRPSQHAQFSSPRVLSNAAAFVNSHMNNHAPSTPTTPQRAGSGSSKTSSSTETTPFHTPMHASFVKWDSPKKSNNNNKKNHNHGKSSTSMMSQALEAENTQFLQQQQGHLSNSRMLSIGFASSNSGNGSSSGSGSSSSSRSRSSSFRAQHSFYRRRGKLGFDKLPREIRVHIFRYLSTFQLVRISRVSRAWRNVALDGSLWKVIDTNRYYKTIQDDQLLHLGVSGAGFLRYVNFRGCAQLSSDSLRVLAEHCPNVERLDLTGCRQLSSKALADVCMNMTSLVHLDLAGLLSVNNYTLQAMAVYCRSLQVLNLAWCRNITGAGLSKLTKTCQQIQKLNVSGCAGLEDRWMPTMGIGLPRLKELCLNGCHSLTDRGLIGLLTGLSVGMTKKYRKKRRSLRRLSSSLRVATLGDDSLHSSSCVDDNDNGIEEEEEDDDEDKDSLDELEKEEISDNDASEIDDEDNEATASAGDNQDTGLPSSSSSSPMAQQEGLQTRLRYLGLSHCRQLTQEALRAIGHHCSRRLRRLEISGCENFGDEGLVFLAQHCTGLQRLDLEDDSLLTDASLRSFGMYLPHLERVCLSYCENITDQGVLRMLRPLTVNSNTPVNMAVNPDKFCSKLSHLELDNCVLVTDRLLLEFANVLEDRRIRNIEKQREKERKREERRERIRQKKKKAASDEVHDEEGGVGDEEEQEEAKNNVDSLRRYRHNYHGSRHSESSLRSLVEIVQNSMPSTSYVASSPTTTTTTTLVEEPTTTATTVNMSSSSSSSAATATAAAAATFISSAPVNIPTTAPYRFHPSLAAAATGAATSSSLSISSSSSPSPLQPRGVLASTSISEEMAIKKAGQRKPILRIIASTRSGTATTTLSSSSCTTSSTTPSSSSSLLPLWPSALHSRRRTMPANNDKNNKNKVRRKRFPPPTIQIFDCRNITLEGVENAQKKCESLVIKSYYSWTNPRTPTATLGTISGRGGAVRGGGLGRRSSSSGYIGGMGYNDNYYYDEGDDDDGSEDDDDDDDDEGESSLSSLNNSHNSLHQLQLQHQQQLQQQPHHRVRNLFHRARLGMMGRAGGGGHGPQCHIL